MVKTIIVPHDGNTMSDAALKFALDIAKSMKMRIVLVRIIPEILDFSTLSFWTRVERKRVRKEINLMKKNAQGLEYEKLKKQMSLIAARGLDGSAFVTEGTDVAEKLVEHIEKEKPALVVIGSKRLKQRGRLSKIRFLGSVARKVSEQSPVPILIFK